MMKGIIIVIYGVYITKISSILKFICSLKINFNVKFLFDNSCILLTDENH